MIRLLRDWWRGWSDEDLINILNKITLHECNPGAIIYVTPAELRAHRAYVEDRDPPCLTL
jgi:hypothetical protein